MRSISHWTYTRNNAVTVFVQNMHKHLLVGTKLGNASNLVSSNFFYYLLSLIYPLVAALENYLRQSFTVMLCF
jgi:hypothetical protein